jgi:hypothetical protein
MDRPSESIPVPRTVIESTHRVIGRFKRGHLWALLKGPFWVNEMVLYDLAPFEALSPDLLSASDPVGALAPFELFSLDPKR